MHGMARLTEGKYVLGALTVFAVWIFIVIPLLYYPRQEAAQNNQRAAGSEHPADNIGNKPPTFVALKLFTTAGRNEIAAYCASETTTEKQKWAHEYICDVKITDTYIAVFNGLLVLVTIGLIAVGHLTIRKMRDTEERQLRAYVFASAEPLEKGINNVWAYTIKFRNCGQTPAYDFTAIANSDVFAIPVSDEQFLVRHAEWMSKAPLPPGEDVSTSNRHTLSAEDVAAIRRGTCQFYVFGEISYIDAFKRKWTTKFRFMHGQGVGPTHLLYDNRGNEETLG